MPGVQPMDTPSGYVASNGARGHQAVLASRAAAPSAETEEEMSETEQLLVKFDELVAELIKKGFLPSYLHARLPGLPR